MKVNVPAVMVTDAEVESKINQVLSQNPKIEEVDRPAAEGDIVNIDYVGKQDGVEFAGGTGEVLCRDFPFLLSGWPRSLS